MPNVSLCRPCLRHYRILRVKSLQQNPMVCHFQLSIRMDYGRYAKESDTVHVENSGGSSGQCSHDAPLSPRGVQVRKVSTRCTLCQRPKVSEVSMSSSAVKAVLVRRHGRRARPLKQAKAQSPCHTSNHEQKSICQLPIRYAKLLGT